MPWQRLRFSRPKTVHPTKVLLDGPCTSPVVFLFAHGAATPMDHPIMEDLATGVAMAGVRVVRFEFPYMARRRTSARRGPPDRQSILLETWHSVIATLGDATTLVIGGRSMGGRLASLIADEIGASGLVCLGYPFHPIGKPESVRVAHLAEIRTPTLIVQGDRDAMGAMSEVATYALPDIIQLSWLADGNHSFAPRKRSGHTHAQHLTTAAARTASFIWSLNPTNEP